jgi:hypothetical protein|nr:MAG TPA: hypothetical protein [Caudoviricetes sp.]
MLRIRCDRPDELIQYLRSTVTAIELESTNRLLEYRSDKLVGTGSVAYEITKLGNARSEIVDVVNKIRYNQPDVVYMNIKILEYLNKYNIDYPDDLIVREVVV